MRFRAARAAKAAVRFVLGVADGSQAPILAPKFDRIGARVGLHETRSTNSPSSIQLTLVHGGWGPSGRIDAAGRP